MNTKDLAPVYLDNQPVSLQDPKPKVSAILSASGKPYATEVKWLQFQPDTMGKAMRPEEVLDRTSEPNKPIYLTSTAKASSGTAIVDEGKKAQPASGSGSAPSFEASRSQGRDPVATTGHGVGTGVGEGQAKKEQGASGSGLAFAEGSKAKPRTHGGKKVSEDLAMGEEADEDADAAKTDDEGSWNKRTSE